MPACAENVKEFKVGKITPSVFHGKYAEVDGEVLDDNTMLISDNIPLPELEYIVAHECGHIIDNVSEFYKEKNRLFGKEPYISNYAKENKWEDFAETYAFHVLWQEGDHAKRRIIARILESLK